MTTQSVVRKKKKHRSPMQIGDRANVILIIILGLFSLICVLPVLLIYISSFTAESAITANGFSFFPAEWSVASYKMLMDQSLKMIVSSYRNTILLTVCGTVLSLWIMSMFAYTTARREFKLAGALAFFAYFTMLFDGGLVSSYIINSNVFKLRDTFWILLLNTLCSAYNIIILRTFFSSAGTESLIEAAKIDGASEFRIYGQIILPISKPAMATIGLFTAIAYFGKWFEVMLYIDDRNLWTIQYLLQRTMKDITYLRDNPHIAMSGEGLEMYANLPNESAKMALTVVAMTPVLVLYPFFQRYFVKGLTLGAIKG